MTACPACGTIALEGARFCASCGASLALRCPGCGESAPAGSRFCPSCGTPLSQASTSEHAEPSEERKVISVLFADLVGFTSDTERSDPEDVQARLTVYHRHIREDVERYGGRIEKLMGDGVFAVFGAPAAHEDDPERAVRSALRIQETIARLNDEQPGLALSVRIGVTTGEAIVQLDTSPDREGIVGDVVNTASRLEAAAPPGGVVVDARTHAATRHAIEFHPLDPIVAKGKSAPIPVWQPTAPLSRYGVAVDDDTASPFVGRAEELRLLVEAFDRTVARRTPQLVTITGEPGAGKSRLVSEFRHEIDDRPDLVWWRQGRCPAYGDGISFWALSEIVKAQAGILESESVAQSSEKLRRTVDSLMEEPSDVDWLTTRLMPLAGAEATGGGAEREELFSAWGRFFEALAARNPLILVIEDLHWADDALVEFLEYLVEIAIDAAILLVCTARPHLYSERPTWGGGVRDAVTIGLGPLDHGDTSALALAALGTAVLPAEPLERLLERSGGNPLYVLEFVRLAREQGLLAGDRSLADLPLPDSIQALISARIDLLDHEAKSLLQTASVVGKVFWPGALAYLRSVDLPSVNETLRLLSRRELVRRARRSSMQGQDEFSFAHSLILEVAYGQLPRSERLRLHTEIARWLEATSGDRLTDVAEFLAHHYTCALDLGARPSDLGDRAYHALMRAAERTEALDAVRSAGYRRRAVDLAPDTQSRGAALLALSQVVDVVDPDAAREAATEARRIFEETGDREQEVHAVSVLASDAWYRGDSENADRFDDDATRLAESLPPCEARARAFISKAQRLHLRGLASEAIEWGELGMRDARQIGSTLYYARALVALGSTHLLIGDAATGESELREALDITLDLNATRVAFVAYNNLATYLNFAGRTTEGLELIREAIELGRQRRVEAGVDWSLMTELEMLFPLGRWDEMLSIIDDLVRRDEARGSSQIRTGTLLWKVMIQGFRGDVRSAAGHIDELVIAAREAKDPQFLAPTLATATWLSLEQRQHTDAMALLDEWDEGTRHDTGWRGFTLPLFARQLATAGETDRLEHLASTSSQETGTWVASRIELSRGFLSEACGDDEAALGHFLSAVDAGEAMGHVFDPTLAHLGAARCLVALGRVEDATPHLETARRGAALMKTVPMLEEIEELRRAGQQQAAG